MRDYTILFLDDDPRRAALMYQRMPRDDRERTIWAQTAQEAIEVLTLYKDTLTIAHLDHDLGGQTFVNSRREDSGMECVRFLERQNPNDYKDCTFIIHTYNTGAGLSMCDRLSKIGYKAVLKPFGT